MNPRLLRCVRRVFRDEKDAINKLLIQEFSRSDDFLLAEPDQLFWDAQDDGDIVLAAWDDAGRVVSTMRAIRVGGQGEAEACLMCRVPEDIEYPAVIFKNAATCLPYRNCGLNQVFRFHFIKAALRVDIQTLISPVYEKAPRIKFMKSLGYRLEEPESTWQTKLKPRSRRMLAILFRSKMQFALDHIQSTRSDILKEYPWHGEPFELDPG